MRILLVSLMMSCSVPNFNKAEDLNVVIQSSVNVKRTSLNIYVCEWETKREWPNGNCYEMGKLTVNSDSCSSIYPASNMKDNQDFLDAISEGVIYAFEDAEKSRLLAWCESPTGVSGVSITTEGTECLQGESQCEI